MNLRLWNDKKRLERTVDSIHVRPEKDCTVDRSQATSTPWPAENRRRFRQDQSGQELINYRRFRWRRRWSFNRRHRRLRGHIRFFHQRLVIAVSGKDDTNRRGHNNQNPDQYD
jgi:hypothetical protein